jgi:hypothetical protein
MKRRVSWRWDKAQLGAVAPKEKEACVSFKIPQFVKNDPKSSLLDLNFSLISEEFYKTSVI